MTDMKKMALMAASCFLLLAWLNCRPASAQRKQGEVEVFISSSGGFFVNRGGDIVPTNLSGSGTFSFDSASEGFDLFGGAGYFVTRKNELGGGIGLSVFHFSSCFESFTNGQITDKSCSSNNSASVGLSGLYRHYFGKETGKGFPFVGGEISVSDLVHRDFTGNVSAGPDVGYRYFLAKNVALDFSLGYTVSVNKVSSGGFSQTRRQNINGEVGFAIVF